MVSGFPDIVFFVYLLHALRLHAGFVCCRCRIPLLISRHAFSCMLDLYVVDVAFLYQFPGMHYDCMLL